MMNKVKSCTLLLMILTLSGMLSSGLRADEAITLNRNSIHLTDRNITGQIVMDMALDAPSSFSVRVLAPAYGGGQDKNYFYLKPKGNNADKKVKVHIDFPYEQLTPGGPYKPETFNTVKVNGKRMATNQFTLCPDSGQPSNRRRVCKPLSLVVIDNGSVPGTTYQTQLAVFVQSANNQPVKKTITLSYKNTQSTIGIYSPDDRFILNSKNHFTDENSFCVYSRGESRSFDVRLEGAGKQKGFELRNRSGERISYRASVGDSNRSYRDSDPNEWHDIATQSKKVSDNSGECGADRNLWVALNIPESEVVKEPAGHYTGTLTVRVRAK